MSFKFRDKDRPPSDFSPAWCFWLTLAGVIFSAGFWSGIAVILIKIFKL